MRTHRSSTAAMVWRESISPSLQTETQENGNSCQILLPLAGSHNIGGGVAFNRVVADVQPQIGPVYDFIAKEDEEKSLKEAEGSDVAAAEKNLSGVRKKLLIPAEEALEGARAAAELVMKDAMDALQRTKQRLMEILLPHHSASQALPPAEDKASKINSEPISADEADSEGTEKTTEVMHIFPEATLGIISPLHQRGAEAVAVVVQSRL